MQAQGDLLHLKRIVSAHSLYGCSIVLRPVERGMHVVLFVVVIRADMSNDIEIDSMFYFHTL